MAQTCNDPLVHAAGKLGCHIKAQHCGSIRKTFYLFSHDIIEIGRLFVYMDKGVGSHWIERIRLTRHMCSRQHLY